MAADTSTFALAITDSAKLMNFLSSYPADSSVDVLGTNSWEGDKEKTNTLLGQYTLAKSMFQREGYPEKELFNYANIFMAHNLDIGVTFFKKIGGEFKEMKFNEVRDSRNRKRFRITICD